MPLSDAELDQPIFDPAAFRLTDKQVELTTSARRIGQEKFAERAYEFDRDAVFPTQNYRDMHDAGLLGICVPEDHGGRGADYKTYMITAAEIGRYCGATALTWNMHVCSCLWTGALADDLPMSDDQRSIHESRRAIHYRRIVDDGAIYAQPFSEGGAAAAGFQPFGTTATRTDGGWLINGKKIFASLSGLRRLLRHPVHGEEGEPVAQGHHVHRRARRLRRPRGCRRLGPTGPCAERSHATSSSRTSSSTTSRR